MFSLRYGSNTSNSINQEVAKDAAVVPQMYQGIIKPEDLRGSSSSDVINNSINYQDLLSSYFGSLSDMEAAARAYDNQVRQENYAFNSAQAKEQRLFESEQARLNREFQQTSADKAMAFTANENQINREFQERMSNSAYQRAVEDMRKAGLSPLLAYSQGGASSPAGSSGSGVSASGSAAKGSSASSGYSLSSRQQQQTVTSLIGNLLDYLVRSESNDIKKTEVAIKGVSSVIGSIIPG